MYSTFKKLLSRGVNLVITPDSGFPDNPDFRQDEHTRLRVEENGLWVDMLSECQECGAYLPVHFCLSNYISATSTRVEAPITCRSCRKTQLKKISYYVEEVDNIHQVSM